MIYTVTLNPAIDKTIQIGHFEKGALNRVEHCLTNLGGKGINVSFALKALGAESVALGLAGGENGRQIIQGLEDAHIENHFLETGMETRTNIKIMEKDGTLTELNEAGAEVSKDLAEAFCSLVEERVKKGDILVLSGSVPGGIPATIYRDLTYLAHEKGARVILDADGELFAYGVEAGPDVVKPNEEELHRYIMKRQPEEQMQKQVQYLLERGIKQVILSRGEKGACFFEAGLEEFWNCPAIPVEVCSTVGAGDAMAAAWAYAMDHTFSWQEAVKLAMAASAAAVTTPGTMSPTVEVVRSLEDKVRLNVEKF